ncbi:hypothetical protein D3C86_2056870 [compost metagenome]
MAILAPIPREAPVTMATFDMLTPAMRATRAAPVVTTGIAAIGAGCSTGGHVRGAEGALGYGETGE